VVELLFDIKCFGLAEVGVNSVSFVLVNEGKFGTPKLLTSLDLQLAEDGTETIFDFFGNPTHSNDKVTVFKVQHGPIDEKLKLLRACLVVADEHLVG
jgi:hypothetical protein